MCDDVFVGPLSLLGVTKSMEEADAGGAGNKKIGLIFQSNSTTMTTKIVILILKLEYHKNEF